MNSHGSVILVTGATGYIGGRLVSRLLNEGHTVRVVVRTPEKLKDVPWAERVEIVQGDLQDPDTMEAACGGVDALYYLVHSMGSGRGFERRESSIAATVASAATAAGVGRIIYLGGLHPDGVALSTHMRSRTEVGRILLESGTPTIAFQAGVVIGSGSASFEMIRHLADVLPVMPAPKWVLNRIEPIAVRDVIQYLVGALGLPEGVNRTFDIGSREVLTYAEMMNQYAEAAGLPRRTILALPVLTPRLAGHWVNLVTPIPRVMAMPLIESLQHDAITAEHDIDEFIPVPVGGLTGYRTAVDLALGKMRGGEVETSWAGASSSDAVADPLPSDPQWAGHTVFTDLQTYRSSAPAPALWSVVEGIGGENGWYSWPVAWAARGWMDKLVGGVGLRRGRRDADELLTGEALDFWRVEELVRGERLRLRAEMKVPGRAWLELSVEPDGTGSTYRQRAVFFPKGLSGRLYWLAVLPFHNFIFKPMARNIARAAEAQAAQTAG
ncbi:MAG: Nucleoside-diphosphate-sugar epimerase [uncultured Arthrobacter sp.]|uniref:Nucleoside-diphosphate-sugar epimerase n=1 Tax=uncultured Arthrobacter sp. TaxID=114050 RepID=A0A6J4J3K9_9MICC|nr:SDR family oxidoreductase [uncultured Arthrobacter sp.]CAA9268566.1 MAG: Nucleoside-diphosphate-sugar epimerase [uncultured Arthrobacter sp.]